MYTHHSLKKLMYWSGLLEFLTRFSQRYRPVNWRSEIQPKLQKPLLPGFLYGSWRIKLSHLCFGILVVIRYQLEGGVAIGFSSVAAMWQVPNGCGYKSVKQF